MKYRTIATFVLVTCFSWPVTSMSNYSSKFCVASVLQTNDICFGTSSWVSLLRICNSNDQYAMFASVMRASYFFTSKFFLLDTYIKNIFFNKQWITKTYIALSEFKNLTRVIYIWNVNYLRNYLKKKNTLPIIYLCLIYLVIIKHV